MRLLTISSLFPNPVTPNKGLFVRERLTQTMRRHPVEAEVVSPVPYFPSRNPRFGQYAQFASVPAASKTSEGLSVNHPKYFMLPTIGSGFSPAAYAHAVRSRCAEAIKRADLIDAHFLFPDGVAATLLAREFGKPVVLTARGSDVNFMPDEFFAGRWLRWMFAQQPQLVAVSEALGVKLRALAPQCSVQVITNGVDLERFRPLAPKAELKAKLGVHGPMLISIGNLLALKGHDFAIRAAASIPNAVLFIAGEGPDRVRLETLIVKLGVQDRVFLKGSRSQDELLEYYGAADALVLASSHEGMPNVLLECLACGTPVVGTAEGAAEVIQKCAYSKKTARDPAAIGAALRELLRIAPSSEDVRQSMRAEGWDAKCHALHALYTELVH